MTRKGWCPGALRPMRAGDGLLLRVRPHGSRLDPSQVAGLASISEAFGNGQFDLGSRATLQLRGVREDSLPEVQRRLQALELLDADPRLEARRNIMTTPFWREGDGTPELVRVLEEALRSAPDLPPKFGFTIDTGECPALQDASADIRIERAGGDLLLRADRMARGERVGSQTVRARIVELLDWFASCGQTRMAQALAAGIVPPLHADAAPDRQAPLGEILRSGPFLFAPFGAVTSQALSELSGSALRLTPWRAVLPEGPARSKLWLTDPSDPLLRVSACTGSPGCASASVATRELARELARHVPAGRHLHVSGCAKGCARPAPASVTLTGRDGCFDLIPDGPAGGEPSLHGLSTANLSNVMRGHLGSQL
jgi:precorrin-3B synthase